MTPVNVAGGAAVSVFVSGIVGLGFRAFFRNLTRLIARATLSEASSDC